MRFGISKVNGHSMHPALESGDFVVLWYSTQLYQATNLFCKLPLAGSYLATVLSLKIGDIVAINHREYGQIIKRVAQLEYVSVGTRQTRSLEVEKSPLKRLRLKGDNQQASTSEAAIGWVNSSCLMGKVIYHVRRG